MPLKGITTLPKSTAEVPSNSKFVPLMVSVPPPDVSPDAGLMPVTIGAG